MTTVTVPPDWRAGGVRVVRTGELSGNTAQTPGMERRAAVTPGTGAHALWGGTVDIRAGAATGAHHHGSVESIIYVLSGRARMRWGAALEFVADAGPGDFIFVPPFVPHQEINAGDAELKCVVVRRQPAAAGDAVIFNLPDLAPVDLASAEWVDSVHPAGHVYGRADDGAAATGAGGPGAARAHAGGGGGDATHVHRGVAHADGGDGHVH